MGALIPTLIDKQDTNEIVRDKIAVILAVEIANQKSLAIAAGKSNVNDWFFRVYIERAKPWEVLTDNDDGDEIGRVPLINVSFDSDSFSDRGSANIEQQKATGIFYIDCYAHKNATNNITGDEATSKDSDRIARLARNILMFGDYMYLKLQGIVIRRYISKREKLKPDMRQEGFENIVVSRITFEVDYNELTLQAIPSELETVFGEAKIGDTGEVYFDVEFDYT